jgi:hypothetical protein
MSRELKSKIRLHVLFCVTYIISDPWGICLDLVILLDGLLSLG